MKLKEIIKDLNYTQLANFSNYEIKGISCNSNCIRPGYLFVAIKGERFDGHSFLKPAINKGASAVILQKDSPLEKKVERAPIFEEKVIELEQATKGVIAKIHIH